MTVEKVNKTFFIDEKLFKLHKPRNTQNNHVYFEAKKKFQMIDLFVKRSSFPKNVSISAGSFEAVARNAVPYTTLVSQR